jgi:hypothetical protein
LGVDGFEDILEEFPPAFEPVKLLCRELRRISFPYWDGLVVGTPGEPKVLYEPIIKAFDEAIHDVKLTENNQCIGSLRFCIIAWIFVERLEMERSNHSIKEVQGNTTTTAQVQ